MNRGARFWAVVLAALLTAAPASQAVPRKSKVHSVSLGAERKVPYSKASDPAGAAADENSLKVRALVVDGVVKDWTTGEAHDVTGSSFVVRGAIRLNNSLPGDKQIEWAWQRGPWLLVNRQTRHILALKLPRYDPSVSQVVWFRDYGAYCGVAASGKILYAVVAQIAVRKPVLAKKLSAFALEGHTYPACAPADWQREPLRVTFHPTGQQAVSFDILPGSAVPVEDAGDQPESPAAVPEANHK
jgi:hypothetical protein